MITSITLPSIGVRIVLFAILWWVLSEGRMDSWYIGIPAVVLASWASLALMPGFSLSLRGLLRFIPFFLWHSLRGGIDVAWRALHPRLLVSPGMVEYRWRLPPGLPQVFMASTVSLLPGTLSAELDETCLHIHALDITDDISSELLIIEERVADLFALDLSVV